VIPPTDGFRTDEPVPFSWSFSSDTIVAIEVDMPFESHNCGSCVLCTQSPLIGNHPLRIALDGGEVAR